MKKYLSLAVFGMVALTACEKTPKPNPTDKAPSTESTNQTANSHQSTYTVAIDPYYPPFEYLEKDGTLAGFDVDLLNAIGEKEGFKPNYQTNKILKIIEQVKDSKYDMGASSIFILPERQILVDYFNAYFELPLAFVGMEKDNRPQSIDDIKNKKISVQKDIIMEKMVDQDFVPKGNQKIAVKSNFLAFKEVLNGSSDMMLDNVVTIQGFMPKAEGKKLFILPLPASKNLQLGYVVKKGNIDLLNKLNNGLDKVKADGTYDKIYDKWFGKNSQYPIVNMDIQSQPVH